jgi:hypothetical protein
MFSGGDEQVIVVAGNQRAPGSDSADGVSLPADSPSRPVRPLLLMSWNSTSQNHAGAVPMFNRPSVGLGGNSFLAKAQVEGEGPFLPG